MLGDKTHHYTHLVISLRLDAKGNNALFPPFLSYQKITENIPGGRVIGENWTKKCLHSLQKIISNIWKENSSLSICSL